MPKPKKPITIFEGLEIFADIQKAKTKKGKDTIYVDIRQVGAKKW